MPQSENLRPYAGGGVSDSISDVLLASNVQHLVSHSSVRDSELVRLCLHCVGCRGNNIVPRLLGKVFHGVKIDLISHFNYITLREDNEIDMDGLVDGSFDNKYGSGGRRQALRAARYG